MPFGAGHLYVVLINKILSTRVHLYQVKIFYREKDTELLFYPCIEADHFNDVLWANL